MPSPPSPRPGRGKASALISLQANRRWQLQRRRRSLPYQSPWPRDAVSAGEPTRVARGVHKVM